MKPSAKQREALDLVAQGRFFPDLRKEDDGAWYARWRAAGGADNDWVDEFVRRSAMTPLTEDAEDMRHETIHDAWLAALRSRSGLVRRPESECEAFAAELAAWHGGGDDSERKALVFRFADLSITVGIPRSRKGLRALGEAAYVFGPLRELKRDGDVLRAKLNRTEAESFVRSGGRDLADAGYTVEGVDIAAGISSSAEIADDPSRPGCAKISKIRVRVAGEEVTAAEIRFMLDQGSTLVFFRDRWIEVDRNILRNALKVLEKRSGKTLSRAEALAFSLGLGRLGALAVEPSIAKGKLRALVESLKTKGAGAELRLDGFAGTLRAYQRRGVEWLASLTSNGFGALLADDMGLGKTVQTIAWLADLRRRRPGAKALVVAPLTLLANWRREFAAFAPGFRVYVHHGESRSLSVGFPRRVAESDVVITSYALLTREFGLFRDTEWAAVALDEAQALKNPLTKIARAAKALAIPERVALTGTPVENSVADVWSIEEFLNPRFLPELKTFERMDPRRIRDALEPFVARRLKSDPAIAGEIGEKREIREYCALSPVQRAEYERALADYRQSENARGSIFALINELKLICDGEGKLARLDDLLDSIFAAGESALVFSQYAKVGEMLRERISARFGGETPFLHGALTAAERERQNAAFNRRGERAFVLSLRAGGFGLNLTKATHVIHFDRWWNPAVENQATDRAHRIGQEKTVFSHLFITEGTLEEHVDDILRAKSALADSVITEAEWLKAAELDE
ncbi:MAG: hypothetical protein ILO34_06640 [Kiritimatiellae bacterium]|nr:hypothetical protein [Kiritimatiellia bacterium]